MRIVAEGRTCTYHTWQVYAFIQFTRRWSLRRFWRQLKRAFGG